jgi:Ni,Fe-hydrogenase III large subunit
MHVADLSALCTDVAYQLGSAVFGALRTPLINFFQSWCGNRFGRSLIRPAGSHFPLYSALRAELRQLIAHFTPQYTQMAERTFSLPSVLSRFEGIGKVTTKQAESIGAVGMAARTCGLQLDARASHPFAFYAHLRFQPQVQHSGDVYARAMLRHEEVLASLELILAILDALDEMPQETIPTPNLQLNVAADSVVVSIVEGWRGEIVHTLFTDANGNIRFCKVKDPSLHNWFALALAVRNAEISDFPICNKSFNLSYCGNDL